MFKHALLLIIATVAGVIFRHQLVHVLDWLLYLHNELAAWLAVIFSSDSVGRMIQGVAALIVIPGVIGGVTAGGYWLVKHESFKHTMTTIWMVWIILLVTMLVQMSFTGSIGAQPTPQTSYYSNR